MSREEPLKKTVVILTAPYEEEGSGDIAAARMMESIINSFSDVKAHYLKCSEVYENTGRSSEQDKKKMLALTYPLSDVFETAEIMGRLFLQHIIRNFNPENTILFLHTRTPHTGYAFGPAIIDAFQSAGFKVMGLMHEYAFNYDDIARASRNMRFLNFAPQLDAVFFASRMDAETFFRDLSGGYVAPLRDDEALETYREVLRLEHAHKDPEELVRRVRSKTVIQPFCSIFCNERTNAFSYTFDDLQSRRDDIVFLSMIRRHKGIEECMALAEKLDSSESNITINVCGRVYRRDFTFFVYMIEKIYGIDIASTAQTNLSAFATELEAALSLTDDEKEDLFNSHVRALIQEIQRNTVITQRINSIRLHIGLSDDEVKKVAEKCKMAMRFDDKGMGDNASGYLNLMYSGCVPIATVNPRIMHQSHHKVIISCGDTIAFKELTEEQRTNIIYETILSVMRNPEVLKLKQRELIDMMQTTHSYDAFKHAMRRLIDIVSPTAQLSLLQKQPQTAAKHKLLFACLFNLFLVCMQKFYQDEKLRGRKGNPDIHAMVDQISGSRNLRLFREAVQYIEFREAAEYMEPDSSLTFGEKKHFPVLRTR